jgi:hypothetical protein
VSDLALHAATGDLALVAGAASLVTGPRAAMQHWRARISLFLGEWFLDTSLGLDFQNRVFIKAPRLRLLRSMFVAETLKTPGIVSCDSMQLTLNAKTRALEVLAEVTFSDGSISNLQTSIGPES